MAYPMGADHYTPDPKTKTYTTASPTSSPIRVYAEGAFQSGVPVAVFEFNDGIVSGSAFDDSENTMVQTGTESSPTWVPLVFKFSGHTPKTLIDLPPNTEQSPTYGSRTPASTATAYTEVAFYKYQLLDNNDDPMPGVWIQERFTAPVPSYFIINNVNTHWITRGDFAQNNGAMSLFDGFFNSPDRLAFEWYDPNPTNYEPIHIFYAGTRDPTIGATTGINVGTYRIIFVPGWPNPGSASQSKQP